MRLRKADSVGAAGIFRLAHSSAIAGEYCAQDDRIKNDEEAATLLHHHICHAHVGILPVPLRRNVVEREPEGLSLPWSERRNA